MTVVVEAADEVATSTEGPRHRDDAQGLPHRSRQPAAHLAANHLTANNPPAKQDPSDLYPPGLAARGIIALVRLYQAVHPSWRPSCRYLPTCSEYAAVALGRYGAVRGGWLAVRRLFRCHPWGGYGADPVPERLHVRNPS